MAMARMRPAAMPADVPAAMQPAIAVPAAMAAATGPTAMPVAMPTLDLDGDRVRREMLGEGGCGCRGARRCEGEGGGGNPDDSTCLQRLNSLNSIDGQHQRCVQVLVPRNGGSKAMAGGPAQIGARTPLTSLLPDDDLPAMSIRPATTRLWWRTF